jgi:hypothetical protein
MRCDAVRSGGIPRFGGRAAAASWLLVAVGLGLLAGCGPESTRTVPDELLGRWTTKADKYADTFFELQRDTLILGLAGGRTEIRPVTKVERVVQDGETLFTVFYVDPSDPKRTEFKLAFFFERGPGVVRWKNQKEIAWTRPRG